MQLWLLQYERLCGFVKYFWDYDILKPKKSSFMKIIKTLLLLLRIQYTMAKKIIEIHNIILLDNM